MSVLRGAKLVLLYVVIAAYFVGIAALTISWVSDYLYLGGVS